MQCVHKNKTNSAFVRHQLIHCIIYIFAMQSKKIVMQIK